MIAGPLAVVLAAAAAQADPSAHLRPAVAVALEYDTNAARVPSGTIGAAPVVDVDGDGVDDTGAAAAAQPVVGDALVRAALTVAADARRDGARLAGDVALGGKLFATAADQRMAVAQGRATLDAALPWGFTSTLGLFAKARGQASFARTYGVARADALLSRAVAPGIAVRGGVAGVAFHAFDAPIFTSMGNDASLAATWSLTAAERLDVTGTAGLRAFPLALPAPLDPATQPVTTGRRLDVPLGAHAAFTSARRVFVSVTYGLERSFSNSRGEAYARHRLAGLVGFRLPERITATMRGAVQLTAYDQGVSLGQRYFLGEDEESQNNLELMLSRPWLGGVVIEGRLFWMGNELAKEGARFSRATASLGVRAEL